MDFIKGFIVGMGASIPLGPIGVLCIQRTLSKGRNSGLITGMGAALTDTFFAAIALLSLTFVNDLIGQYRFWVMIVGGIIVLIFGLKLFLTNPVKQIKRIKSGNKRYWEDFFSTILMTITNPGALFLILGLFAFAGINSSGEESKYLIATTLWGVFSGAISWWFILSTSINVFRNRFRLRQLLMINRVAGVIIMVLGIISLFEGIIRFLN